MSQEPLFDLIRSLTSQEKTYIRRSSLFQQKHEEKLYLILFNMIERQRVYDEKLLRKKFLKENPTKNFSAVKSYLLDYLLQELSNYHASPRNETRNLLNRFTVAFDKGLMSLAEKQLANAWALAEKNNLLYQSEEILALRLMLMRQKTANAKTALHEMDGLLRKIKEVQEQSEISLRLRQEQFRVFVHSEGIMPSRTEERSEYFARKAKDLLSFDRSKLHSFEPTYQYYQLLTSSLYSGNQTREALRWMHEFCAWLDTRTEQLDARASSFVSAHYNKALYEMVLHKAEARKTLEKIEALIKDKKQIGAHQRVMFWQLKMLLAWETCKYEEALEASAWISEWLKKQSLSESYFHDTDSVCRFMNACVHFTFGKIPQALKELRRLLQKEKDGFLHAYYSSARILLLLIEFDRGDRLGMENEIRSTMRHLAKRKQLFKVEHAVLRFLRHAVRHLHYEDELSEGFRKLREEVLLILADRNEMPGARLFDLVSYLDSKIEGISFEEARKQNAVRKWGKSIL